MKNDTWTEEEIVQAPLAQLTWYHHLTLLDKLDTKEKRLAYARLAAKNGWSRNVMAHHTRDRPCVEDTARKHVLLEGFQQIGRAHV